MNPPCPCLPEVTEIHDFNITRRHGGAKGAQFYQDTLSYAQALWISGKPAQALLQLDKAWMADPADDWRVLVSLPPPYQALVWILKEASNNDCGYLGNPVRHFQHLASRMSGPRREIRSARAWLGFHLAAAVLPGAGFPPDGRQLVRDGLWIPAWGHSLHNVRQLGWPGEAELAGRAMLEIRG